MRRKNRFPVGRWLRAVQIVLLAGGLGAAAGSPTRGVLILRKTDSGSLAELARAVELAFLNRGNEVAPRIMEMSGDPIADGARLQRESSRTSAVVAVGFDATTVAAALGPRIPVVALGVPNPARLKTAGTYFSVYPKLDRVFDLLRRKLGVDKVGLLFTPAHNREIALAFVKAAGTSGIEIVPMPVSSRGDLVRTLRASVTSIDALLLATDPILFDSHDLKLIVDETVSARKPTVGFLPELVELGVTFCLVNDPAAVADAAVARAAGPVRIGKQREEVDGVDMIVSHVSARSLGIDVEGLDAKTVR